MKKSRFIVAALLLCVTGVLSVFAAKEDVAKYLFQAHQLFQKKKYDDAILYFKKASAADPSDATLYYNIGVVYQLKGKAHFPLAKTWYEKALEKDKKLAFAHYNLGVMAFNEGKIEEARKILEVAKTLKPKDKGISEALRETKKTLALIKQSQKKNIQNENTDILMKESSENKKETPAEKTQPLTKTQKTVAPEVKESKTKTQPLTKTQIPVIKPSAPPKENTQPLTQTQKTNAPTVKITETKTKTKAENKKDGKSKESKVKETSKEKGKNVSIKNVVKEQSVPEEKINGAFSAKTAMCADIKNKMPASAKETFSSATDKQVVVWLDLKNAGGKHTLESRWISPDGKVYSSGTRDVIISGLRYRTWFIRKLKGSRMGEKKGKWSVQILIDTKLLKEVNFSVQ